MDCLISKQSPHRNSIRVKAEVIKTIILIRPISTFLGMPGIIECAGKLNSWCFVWIPQNTSARPARCLHPALQQNKSYDNRMKGSSEVWLTPTCLWRVFMIGITDKSYGSHTHALLSCSFLSLCASLQWITMLPIIFSPKNKMHTHTCCYLSSPQLPCLRQKQSILM